MFSLKIRCTSNTVTEDVQLAAEKNNTKESPTCTFLERFRFKKVSLKNCRGKSIPSGPNFQLVSPSFYQPPAFMIFQGILARGLDSYIGETGKLIVDIGEPW